jgi:hypothetical protein
MINSASFRNQAVALKVKYPNGEVVQASEIGEMVEKVIETATLRRLAFILYREINTSTRTRAPWVRTSVCLITLYILKQRY